MIQTLESVLNALAKTIAYNGFVSRAGGLLKEMTLTTSGGPSVRAMARIAPFSDNTLRDMSPDSNETCITFFTAGPTRVLRSDVWIIQCQNEVTLTGWVNGKRIAGNEFADPQQEILMLLQRAKIGFDNGEPIRNIEIEYTGSADKPDVSRYGWDGPEFQYGMEPYYFFQHRFNFTYMLQNGCATQPVQVLSPVC